MNIRCRNGIYQTMAVLGCGVAACYMFGFIDGMTYGWKDWSVMVQVGAGTAFFVAFMAVYYFIYRFIAFEEDAINGESVKRKSA